VKSVANDHYIFPERNRVGVVVATHKNCSTLDRCLQSLRNMLADPLDLIFVDNGSDEKLYERVQMQFPEITVIRLTENRYFCGGYNAGIRVAVERGYDFVLIVNADTEVVNPEFLPDLLKTAQRWPRAAFIGPLVYFRSQGAVQKTCLEFPRVLRNVTIWLPWRLFPQYFLQQPKEETTVEFLNGICVLCRISALREIGLMDENMGGYVEDADWAWRAKQKGWVSVFAPVPSVVHHETPSGYEPYSLKTFLLKRNTVYWFLKIRSRYSAWSYAQASIVLALARLWTVRCADERKKHRYFLQRLTRVFNGLLRGEPLSEWFGPPLGLWEGHVS
jgi:GT2 family glycosyltransferase